ncbi:MAG: bS21 family ribosomal protein [Candidatus Kerfeldbacteria bacterium]
MIDVDRKDDESNDGMIRRFTRKVQSSGVLPLKKRLQFHTSKPNKRSQKESAIRRSELREEREFLIKTGKLEEEPYYARGRQQRGGSGGKGKPKR